MIHLERCCQLHESIEIFYIVCAYQARLLTQDGAKIIFKAEGRTIQEALELLNTMCESYRVADIRKLTFEINSDY